MHTVRTRLSTRKYPTLPLLSKKINFHQLPAHGIQLPSRRCDVTYTPRHSSLTSRVPAYSLRFFAIFRRIQITHSRAGYVHAVDTSATAERPVTCLPVRTAVPLARRRSAGQYTRRARRARPMPESRNLPARARLAFCGAASFSCSRDSSRTIP